MVSVSLSVTPIEGGYMFMETAQMQKEQMEVAQMRFGIIAPLVQ